MRSCCWVGDGLARFKPRIWFLDREIIKERCKAKEVENDVLLNKCKMSFYLIVAKIIVPHFKHLLSKADGWFFSLWMWVLTNLPPVRMKLETLQSIWWMSTFLSEGDSLHDIKKWCFMMMIYAYLRNDWGSKRPSGISWRPRTAGSKRFTVCTTWLVEATGTGSGSGVGAFTGAGAGAGGGGSSSELLELEDSATS